MRVLYIYGVSRQRRMYLHNPGLTQFKDWKIACVNGKMNPGRLAAIRRPFDLTVLHGYQCYRAVQQNLDRKKMGLLVFVPSNDVPWFNGRNTQAVLALKPQVVLAEQRVRLDWYQQHAPYAEWFPPACATDVFRPLGIEPTHDIAFAGTMARASKYGTRNEWVRAFPVHGYTTLIKSGVTQEQFNEIYNRGRLAFHMSQFFSEGKRPQGTAYRIFEVGGIGRPLVLDTTPAIRKLFRDGEHFIGYSPGEKSWAKCLDKIHYYLRDHTEKGEEIGQAMRAEILAKHTYQHRGQRLRKIVEARI